MIGDLLTGGDFLRCGAPGRPDGEGDVVGDLAQRGPRLEGEDLDFHPGLETPLVRPDATHLGKGVALDHGLHFGRRRYPPRPMRRISIEQARRYALAAQGFTEPRSSGRADVRHFRRVLDRVLVIQLDSVNVFSRAHYLPFFSRLGIYDRARLDQWLWRSGEMFEYWGHMASVLPMADHRLFRWRMERGYLWTPAEKELATRPGYLDAILEEVRERGPMQTSELEDPGVKDPNGSMWNWSVGKIALEMLFVQGRVAAADRRNFVRMYDIAERVIDSEQLQAPTPPIEEAQSILLERSARALGVGTADDIADYYRIRMPDARPLISAVGVVRSSGRGGGQRMEPACLPPS